MAIAAFGLSVGISGIGDILPSPVYALLSGLNAATVGIVALAAVQLSQKAVTDRLTRILVFLGGTAGMLYNALWYFPAIMVAAGLITILWDLRLPQALWSMATHPAVVRNDIETAPSVHVGGDNLELSSEATPVRQREDKGAPANTRRGNEESNIEPPLSATDPTSSGAQRSPSQSSSQPKLKSWKIGCSIVAGFFATFVVIVVLRGKEDGSSRAFDLFGNLYLAGKLIQTWSWTCCSS